MYGVQETPLQYAASVWDNSVVSNDIIKALKAISRNIEWRGLSQPTGVCVSVYPKSELAA